LASYFQIAGTAGIFSDKKNPHPGNPVRIFHWQTKPMSPTVDDCFIDSLHRARAAGD